MKQQKTTDLLKATVVSFCPFDIKSDKPGLIPGFFTLLASTENKPYVITVGDSMFYVYLDENRGSLQITTSAFKVAQSIVDDFLNSQLGASSTAHPAIFWVPGVYTAEEIMDYFGDQVKEKLAAQKNWYIELVKIADDDWERLRQHNAISDTQRHAAKSLGQERPWIIKPTEHADPSIKRCVACGNPVGDVVVCPNCRCILDPVRYATLKFAQ